MPQRLKSLFIKLKSRSSNYKAGKDKFKLCYFRMVYFQTKRGRHRDPPQTSLQLKKISLLAPIAIVIDDVSPLDFWAPPPCHDGAAQVLGPIVAFAGADVVHDLPAPAAGFSGRYRVRSRRRRRRGRGARFGEQHGAHFGLLVAARFFAGCVAAGRVGYRSCACTASRELCLVGLPKCHRPLPPHLALLADLVGVVDVLGQESRIVGEPRDLERAATKPAVGRVSLPYASIVRAAGRGSCCPTRARHRLGIPVTLVAWSVIRSLATLRVAGGGR